MFSSEERKRAVEPCLMTSMTTAEVVEHLGYPTRQCLERWLARGPRYAGRMRSPIIPLETRRKTIEPVSGHAAEASRPAARRGRGCRGPLGQGVSRGRHGRVAAQEQERRAGRQGTVEAAA